MNPPNLLNYTCFMGLLMLNFCCYFDFKRNIVRPKSSLPFYSALFLFLFANSVIYMALLSFSVGIEFDPQVLFYYGKATEYSGIGFKYRHSAPLVVAVLYFGAGKAKFEFFGKEFSLYDNMIQLFRTMFPLSLGASKQLNTYLDKLGEETEKLNNVIDKLHQLAKERNWKIQNEEWSDIEKDKKLIENDIKLLEEIDSSISENLNQLDVKNTKKKLRDEIKKLRVNINTRLKKYTRNVIAANIRDEMALPDIAEILDIAEPGELLNKRPPSFLARSLGLSFICGTSLGIVLQLTTTTYGPYERILFLCVAFFIFLSVFTNIKNNNKSIEGFSYALFLGAIAGFFGHLAFECIYRIMHSRGEILQINAMQEIVCTCILGMALGTFSALIAFFFRHFLSNKIKSMINKYLLIGVMGGFSFWLLLMAFGELKCSMLTCPKYHIAYFLTGVIVLLGIAFVSGVLEQHDKKIQDSVA